MRNELNAETLLSIETAEPVRNLLLDEAFGLKDRANTKASEQPVAANSGNSTDREYGKPSPARQEFNNAFAEFRALQATHPDEIAFEKTGDKMKDAIHSADKYSEKAQSVFYDQLDSNFMKDGKPIPEVIDKLQLLSTYLQQVTPGEREDLMRDLVAGKLEKLKNYDDVKDMHEIIRERWTKNGVPALLKTWFDYRAGLGDSIGQRQVFIGLCDRFGSKAEARKNEQIVQDFKDRIGGKYLY